MSDYNKKPIVLTEGKAFIDGEEIFDCVKCEIKFTPETYTGKVLGERSPSTRWKGFTITGTITRRRSTPFLKEIVQRYQKDGVEPEFTIQGVMDDKGISRLRYANQKTLAGLILKFFLLCLKEVRDFEE